MAIKIHSNADYLKSKYGIPPNEVDTALDIFWAKPIKSKNS